MAAAVSGAGGSFGRGKGRGRGMLDLLRQPKAATQRPPGTKVTTTPESSLTAISTTSDKQFPNVINIMRKLDGLTDSKVMTDVLPEIEALRNPIVIEALVNELTEKALVDTTFALIAAKLAHKIWDNESMHTFIRNPLLKQTLDFYNRREKLQEENKFLGLVVYLCELFKYLRLNGKPLLVVGEAAVFLLKGLMETSDSPSKEDIFYCYQELESVGSIIGECFPEKLDEIINLARRMVISESLLPSVRCQLVQLIELHAAKWSMKNDMKTKYNVLLHELNSSAD